VRQVASDLLARLPASAYVGRHVDRLTPLLALQRKAGGLRSKSRSTTLVIELPNSLDKAALRDGHDQKPPAHRKIGERAFWFEQWLAVPPPRVWTERFACLPSEFLNAAFATDFGDEILRALTTAAARHQDSEWIRALGRACIERRARSTVAAEWPELVKALAQSAPAEDREALVLDWLAIVGDEVAVASFLLPLIGRPWSAAATRIAMRVVARLTSDSTQRWNHSRDYFAAWAICADVPTAAPALETLLAACAAESPWRNALDVFSDTLSFRTAMLQELTI
jgi:Family of unknown function (DUF5691)